MPGLPPRALVLCVLHVAAALQQVSPYTALCEKPEEEFASLQSTAEPLSEQSTTAFLREPPSSHDEGTQVCSRSSSVLPVQWQGRKQCLHVQPKQEALRRAFAAPLLLNEQDMERGVRNMGRPEPMKAVLRKLLNGAPLSGYG